MNHSKVASIKLLAAGAVLLLALGCASTRGEVGVGWGEPAHHPDVRAARKPGPPPHAPAHGYRAKHCYRYYPASEVYYDTGRRIYFYIEGGVWVADALLPYELRLRLGDYQTVEMDTDKPYLNHHQYKSRGRNQSPPGHAKKGNF